MKGEPFRLFLCHLGALVGEANTDALADLPMPILMDWQDYMRAESPEPSGMKPGAFLEMVRNRFGDK